MRVPRMEMPVEVLVMAVQTEKMETVKEEEMMFLLLVLTGMSTILLR